MLWKSLSDVAPIRCANWDAIMRCDASRRELCWLMSTEQWDQLQAWASKHLRLVREATQPAPGTLPTECGTYDELMERTAEWLKRAIDVTDSPQAEAPDPFLTYKADEDSETVIIDPEALDEVLSKMLG
jgi:hypothetical protein